MPLSSEHPDHTTLSAWLSFELSPEVAANVEQHLESCEQCAETLAKLETPKDLEDQVRAIDRGEATPGPTIAATVAFPNPTEQTRATYNSLDLSGKEIRSSDDTIGNITATWGHACRSANFASQTLKAIEPSEDRESMRLPIKQRSTIHQHEAVDPPKGGPSEDDYRLLNVIGKGGMGVVYSARQSAIDRVVAIKMLKSDDEAKDESRRRLFLQEAVVTADLDHPGIVPVHELGHNDDGTLFYSMKQVDGDTWSDVIRKKSESENLDLLLRVADAIAFAHARGVVHRDIKPENVMIGKFGEVWLMDWGLAQPLPDYRKSELTQKQQMGGTPAYMAPEMTQNSTQIGPLSDVYLLGATLFEIVTGSPPHHGDTVLLCLLAAMRNEIVPVADELKGNKLLEIAFKAMEKRPAKRYQSVAEFQNALRDWLSHSESLTIMANAQEQLQEAERNKDYQGFIRSIFGFEQACSLFSENAEAVKGLSEATFSYARCAAEKGDYDLALSLLDPEDPIQVEFVAGVRRAKREQQQNSERLRRQQKMMRILLTTVAGLTVAGVLVAGWLRSSALQLANTNEPAMAASLSLQSGLRRSMSALRGWVALGDQEFKVARADAWHDEIRPSIGRLNALMTAAGSKDEIRELNARFDELYEEQWWIEDVAQTPGNEPATDLLFRDIDPIESSISKSLEGLVDLQSEVTLEDASLTSENPSDWRDATALQMTFARCHRFLVDVVRQGDRLSQTRFQDELREFEAKLNSIQQQATTEPDQQNEALNWIAKETMAYRRLATEAIRRRSADQSNVAEWRLRTQAIPSARRAEDLITDIVSQNRVATLHNSEQINRISMIAITIGTVFAVGVLLAGLLTFLRGRRDDRIASLTVSAFLLTGMFFGLSPSPGIAQDNPTGVASPAEDLPANETLRDGSGVDDSDVSPPDVFRKVSQVLNNLELIRAEMGKPKGETADIAVENAEPHEVYFQALTLFQKIDELCFELSRDRQTPPERANQQIRPVDVYQLVDAVNARLEALKEDLGIDQEATVPPRDAAMQPNDVFKAITVANRQVNRMVERRFSPSDVFQQVTLGVSYCSSLLSLAPGATRLPESPAFESKKTPSDVYRRLIHCYRNVRAIADQSNVKMLELHVSDEDIASAVPSDVYDIASLLLSELAHLHSIRGDLPPPRRVFQPGRTFPSHVYQRAGLLSDQIDQLKVFVDGNPDWLENGNVEQPE